jgi:hypothetical protein
LLAASGDAAEQFLVDWYGEPEGGRGSAVTDSELPRPLRQLYVLASRWPRSIVQNQLVSPPRNVDGRLVFYIENQGVYEWATEGVGDDKATVWGREPDGQPWMKEEPRLAPFTLQLLVFEAIMGASHGASVAWLPSERLPDAVGSLEALPHGCWRWPEYPTRFYAGGDGQLAVTSPNRAPDDPSDAYTVFVAARDAAALAYLDDIVDDSWEQFSRRDPE